MSLSEFSWIVQNGLAGMAMPDESNRDLENLWKLGVRALVCLTVRPVHRETATEKGFECLHLPIPNFEPPSLDQIRRFVEFCEENIGGGRPVAVHCLAGMGRTGTMLACYLVHKGLAPTKAIGTVRHRRPGSIETLSQESIVYEYAATLDQDRQN